MPPARPISVTAFIDWNCQIHATKPKKGSAPEHVARETLSYVGRKIGRTLNRIDKNLRYNVTLRLYHGWRRGFEATDSFKAIQKVFHEEDIISLSRHPNIQIRDNLYFGDIMLNALDVRINPGCGVHLPNTQRRRSAENARPGSFYEEKLVDTALASDVVTFAWQDPDDWIIVAGQDDDLIPPVYTAEAVRRSNQGKVILIREKAAANFYNLEGIESNA